jgi:osmotically-inducible protein OsmY
VREEKGAGRFVARVLAELVISTRLSKSEQTASSAMRRPRKSTAVRGFCKALFTDELFWDPKVDSGAIAVSVDDGVVTLRGTVGSFREKQEAKHDVERVYGAKSVKNELEMRILSTGDRTPSSVVPSCRR